MTPPRRAAGSLAGFALLATLSACTSVAPMHPVSTNRVSVQALDTGSALASVNAFRRENGRAPLRLEPRLAAAAQAQSAAMAARDHMDHSVDGTLPGRVKRFGYQFSRAAENIARGQPNFDAAMAAWINSPGHRRNLLDPTVTEIGFGAVREATSGRIYWTEIFGRPMEAEGLRGGLSIAGFRLPSL